MPTETPHKPPAKPELHIPRFCSQSKTFVYDVEQSRLDSWKNDRRAQAVFLDAVIVCPKCDALPTFRHGCGCCGSALYSRQSLMHHYACAHVAPRQQFQHNDGAHCPKCGQRNLVHGTDCEFITGRCECHDCRHQFDTPELIGHCLNCEHRFSLADGKPLSLFAWEVSAFAPMNRDIFSDVPKTPATAPAG